MLEFFQAWMLIFIVPFLILFIYCILLHVKLNTLSKKYKYFMDGENGVNIERKLAVEVKEIREATASLDDLFARKAIPSRRLVLLNIMPLKISVMICPLPLPY